MKVTNRLERDAKGYFQRFARGIVPAMRRSFSRSLRKLQADFTRDRLSGAPGLRRRTGQLARSLTVRVNTPTRVQDLRGEIFFTNPVAAYHEYGATITGNPWLTVPLDDALTPAGVPRRPNARAWDKTFFFRSRKNKLFLARKKSKRSKLELLYILLKRVVLKPRLGWRKAVRAWRKEAEKDQVKALRKFIRGLRRR